MTRENHMYTQLAINNNSFLIIIHNTHILKSAQFQEKKITFLQNSQMQNTIYSTHYTESGGTHPVIWDLHQF